MSAAPWVAAVAALWPGARVEPPGAQGEGPARCEFVFLPNARSPRLLLPAGRPGAAASALRRYSHDLGLLQRISRSLTATAVRTGLPERALRDRLRVVGGDGESVQDHLGELLDRQVVISVGLGTLRANRKPILHVLTPSGKPVAFVKVGDNSTAQGLIAEEAAALTRLAELALPGIGVPRVLHHGPWRDLSLLVLSPLPTSALGRRSRRTPPVAAMRTLAEAAGVDRTALGDSAYWTAVGRLPDKLTAGAVAGRMAEVIERIGERHGDVTLDFGAWHGDWTPWNMAWHRGVLQLWDWERFACGVPLGLDLLHYRSQQAARTESRSPYEVWPDEAASLLAPLGVPSTGGIAQATVEVYYLELCARYQLAAQEPTGDPVRAQADRLLDLLHAHAGRTM